MLTRDAILKLKDHEVETVNIPEWNSDVCIRTMSGAARDQIEEILVQDKRKDVRALVCILTVCSESGELLFTKADVNALNEKSGKALDRIFAASIKLNKMGEEDIAALTKN